METVFVVNILSSIEGEFGSCSYVYKDLDTAKQGLIDGITEDTRNIFDLSQPKNSDFVFTKTLFAFFELQPVKHKTLIKIKIFKIIL